jgi:hypothetical protein
MTKTDAGAARLYRAYALNSEDIIAGPPVEFESESDSEARDIATRRMHGEPFELWEGGRRVYSPDE